MRRFIAGLCIIAALTGCGENTYVLSVPTAEQVRSAEIIDNEDYERTVITEPEDIKAIVSALDNIKKKSVSESIQDFPVNAEDIISVNLVLEEGGVFSGFIYERGNKYYFEQPYNGIYAMKEKDHDTIEDRMDQGM